MLIKLALIGLGGGIGAMMRYIVGYAFLHLLPSQNLQYGFMATFCVNMIACFCIGLCVAILRENNSLYFAFFVVGVLGGFSTFSSFGLEILKLLQNHLIFMAITYALLSNILGVICVYMGYALKSSS